MELLCTKLGLFGWLLILLQLDLSGGFASAGAEKPMTDVKEVFSILQNAGPDPTPVTAADILQMKPNEEGDLRALLSSLTVDSILVLGVLVIFSVLRLEFPLVYSGNTIAKLEAEPGSPSTPGVNQREASSETLLKLGPGFFSWIPASLNLTIDEVERCAGLDAAMMLEFCNLSIRICAVIGVPMTVFMCPLHFWLGGKDRNDVDELSQIGMANIVPGSWLYWVHAVVIFMVVYAVMTLITRAQERFLERRFQWLKSMPPPRSTTVLVENIPQKYRSDATLRTFFECMFNREAIKAVHVVRDTTDLLKLMSRLEVAERRLAEAQLPRATPSSTPDLEDRLEAEVVRAKELVRAEKQRLRQLGSGGLPQQAVPDTRSSGPEDSGLIGPSPCVGAAFVTFKARREAEIALRLQYEPDAEQFVVSVPPEPSDIRWDDLRTDRITRSAKERLGIVCASGLYVAFVPLTVAVSSVTNLDHLQRESALVRKLVESMPELAAVFEGMLASLALVVFMSFLPSILMLIFDNFYALKANAWAQAKLQVWFFWFQVVFTLLVTVVGSSVIIAAQKIVERPMQIFGLMADSMPSATNFYLNYIVLQWVTQTSQLLRLFNVAKFVILRAVCDPWRAKELSEPEDQDSDGIGARSARWTINLVIAIVFGSLSPTINLLTMVCFCLCRLVYGYLMVFAETPKPDLGGVFFVQALRHVQKGLVIYVAMMIGVLARQCHDRGPKLIGFATLVWLARMMWKFDVTLQWENLPFSQIVNDEEFRKRKAIRKAYIEPELDREGASQAPAL